MVRPFARRAQAAVAAVRRVREPLLGRHAELEVLRGALSDARDGQSRFLFVTGEAGIGKTRLLDELAAIAEDSGFLILRGRGSEFDTERPYAVYAEAFDAYLATLDADALTSLATDRLGALAAVFPSLHGLDRAVDYPVSATERFRAHHAVRDLFERLAARRPLLVILDDVQWADGASLEMTSYLLRAPPEGDIVLAAGSRSGHAGASLSTEVGARQHTTGVQVLDLQPLDAESVRQLVAGARDIDVGDLVHLSGGNPFYALQLARTGLASGPVGEGGLEVPPAVAAAVGVELAALSENDRRVARAAGVAGDPFDLDLAVAACDEAEQAVLETIDVLLARDLLRETDVPRRFQFRHPIVHRAVYNSCPPSIKVSCHRRVVDALRRRGAPPTALAAHVEQSARYGDTSAVAILSDAAEQAATTSPSSSIRWLSAALRIVPTDVSAATGRTGLLARLAASEVALGHFSEAYDALEECLLVASDSRDQGADVRLVVRCAEVEQLLGRHEESRARLERSYAEIDDPASPAGVSLLIALTTASLYLADQYRMLEWGRLAVEAATDLGDRALLAAALAAYTMGAAFAGEERLAVDLHDRCAALVDGLADSEVVARLDALTNLTLAENYLDRHVRGAVHGERALRLARSTGQVHVLPTLTPILGNALALAGEMQRSADVLDDAIEAARLIGDVQGLCMNLFNREFTAVLTGDLETALACGRESVELSHRVDNGVITAFAGALHAQALLEAGDPREALDLLLDSAGGEEIALLAGSWRAHFLELLVRCSLAVGDHERAVAASVRLRSQSDEHGLGLTELMADRADAHVALADGRPEEAVEHASHAVAEAVRIDSRTHAAFSRALLGRALVAAARGAEAIEQFEAAAVEFEALGATRYRDQVEYELRRLGRTTAHRRSAPGQQTVGVDALTGREREVADLVVDRRTNREIAEALFLSTKTVETHMRHIFDKLGVKSRVEVARMLVTTRPSV